MLYIELVGTALGCWAWVPSPYPLLHATNPPVAAFPCYLVGELAAIRLAEALRRRRWLADSPLALRPTNQALRLMKARRVRAGRPSAL